MPRETDGPTVTVYGRPRALPSISLAPATRRTEPDRLHGRVRARRRSGPRHRDDDQRHVPEAPIPGPSWRPGHDRRGRHRDHHLGTVVASISRRAQPTSRATTPPQPPPTTATWDVPRAPPCTINQAVGQPDPTGTSPINFTIVFNEAVSGFATGDVTVPGGTSGGTEDRHRLRPPPTTYTVAVTGMTTPGTVVASIAAGCRDRHRGQRQHRLDLDRQHRRPGTTSRRPPPLDLRTASDSGISNSDDITNAASPVFDCQLQRDGHERHAGRLSARRVRPRPVARSAA